MHTSTNTESRRRILWFGAALFAAAFAASDSAGDQPKDKPSAPQRVYLIGNSLTWDTSPSRLDGDVQWHVDCGKSLPFIFENPEKPCVKSSTLWPQALKDKQYDIISLQVHYGSTLEQDLRVIEKWLAMQPKAVFVIHSGWPRHASQAEEYAAKNPSGKMQHSPAYLNALLQRLREAHPKRVFRQTNATELVARVAKDVGAKRAPFEKLSDLYRDKIHMRLDSGRYLMHNAMRRALGQPLSRAGFEKLDAATSEYLDGVLKSLDAPDAGAGKTSP